mgnify:FL=1
MAGCGALSVAGCVADYPFEKLGNATLVDVGGGQGSLSFPILDRYPSLKLVVRLSLPPLSIQSQRTLIVDSVERGADISLADSRPRSRPSRR